MKTTNDLPDVSYGDVGQKKPAEPMPPIDDADVDDDEELATTDPDLIAILGFDPKDL